jgi:hypothetical protein
MCSIRLNATPGCIYEFVRITISVTRMSHFWPNNKQVEITEVLQFHFWFNFINGPRGCMSVGFKTLNWKFYFYEVCISFMSHFFNILEKSSREKFMERSGTSTVFSRATWSNRQCEWITSLRLHPRQVLAYSLFCGDRKRWGGKEFRSAKIYCSPHFPKIFHYTKLTSSSAPRLTLLIPTTGTSWLFFPWPITMT